MEMIFPFLTKYEKAVSDVREIEDRKQDLLSEIQNLEGTIEVSRNIVTSIDQVVEQKTKEMKSLECEKQKLQNTMLRIMGFKEYKKIKDIACQQIETTLKDKQAFLLIVLVAIIEAFKQDPEKQILLSNVSTDDVHQDYYLERQKKELLQLAELVHNGIANNMVNETINSALDR